MSDEDKMTIDERYKYLRQMKKRYDKADKGGRKRLLDEMESVTGMHRKALIRRMAEGTVRKRRERQRGKVYGADVDEVIRLVSESMDYMCAERLTPNLLSMAQHLARHGELALTEEVAKALGCISVSSVRRRQMRLQRDERRLPRRRLERGNHLRGDIPMKRIAWDQTEAGHLEVDLVHHCGREPSGEYVHTLQIIDVATGWSERAAVLGRSYLAMRAGFERCFGRLPFAVLELHPDNGSEFLNHHMVRYFRKTIPGLTISRSRPYHKNDNPRVEQRNRTQVRSYLGYDRFDTVDQVNTINQLYDMLWLYYNFFQPVMHIAQKVVTVTPQGATRVTRRYDTAATPFDRLCATKAISDQRRAELSALRERTNPRQLRHDIYALLDHIFKLPCAEPGITEDVHLTIQVPSFLWKGEDDMVALSND